MAYNNNYNNNRSPEIEKAPIYDFNRLKDGYADSEGNMKEQFFLGDGERLAKYLAGDIAEDKWGNKKFRNGISTSQLRQFFGEVKALQSKIGKNGENFKNTYPFILMLKSKANYKFNRENINDRFKEFIEVNIDLIKEANKKNLGFETFNHFVTFFEVVVGYFKGEK